MFSETNKQRYIDYKTSLSTIDKYYLPNLFRTTELFEQSLNKDLCNFTTNEIVNMYKTIDYTSYESLIIASNYLGDYTDWCMSQGFVIDSQNHFKELTRDRLSMLVNKAKNDMKVISRERLIEYCMQLPNACDQFILLALFEGLSGKDYCEVWNLKIQDVYQSNNTINVYGRGTRQFSDKLIKYAIESYEQTEWYSMSRDMIKVVNLKPSDLIVKDYPNTKENMDNFRKGRRIYMHLIRTLKFLGLEGALRPNDIANSGMIHMVNSESERLGVSAYDYLTNHREDIIYQYNKPIVRSVFIQKFGDYLR